MDGLFRGGAYAGLSETIWNEYGYDDKLGPTSLVEGIHPLFSFDTTKLISGDDPSKKTREKWSRTSVPLERDQYALLEPTLRLASKMILSPGSLRFLYTVMYGTRRPLMAEPADADIKGKGKGPAKDRQQLKKAGIPLTEILRSLEPLSSVDKLVTTVLRNVGDFIVFDFNDGIETNGYTSADLKKYPSGVSVRHDMLTSGLGSKIQIKGIYFTCLERMISQNGETNDFGSEIIAWQFKLAVTLCHEVVHASFLATNEPLATWWQKTPKGDYRKAPYMEPFIEGQSVAELGFSWENEVFGGMILQQIGNHKDTVFTPLFVCQWPNHMVRSISEPQKRPPERIVNLYLVSTYYLRNIQLQAGWDFIAISPVTDDTLKIRKGVGLMFAGPIDENYDNKGEGVDLEEGQTPQPQYDPGFDEVDFLKTWPAQYLGGWPVTTALASENPEDEVSATVNGKNPRFDEKNVQHYLDLSRQANALVRNPSGE